MKLIGDVVLNHTCGCPICNQSGRMNALSWGWSRLKSKVINGYPYSKEEMIEW